MWRDEAIAQCVLRYKKGTVTYKKRPKFLREFWPFFVEDYRLQQESI